MQSSSRCLARFALIAALMAAVVLAPSAAASVQLGSRVLREGMSGSDVVTLQQLLTRANFRTPTDGHFGPLTEIHVVSFERKYHLTANGIGGLAIRRIHPVRSLLGCFRQQFREQRFQLIRHRLFSHRR